MKDPSLQVEECWAQGGRLGIEVLEGGARVVLRGNHEGLVGLARVLLWLAKYRDGADETVVLERFASFEHGSRLEVRAPR